MAKKQKMGWDFDDAEATDSAKSSIQRTTSNTKRVAPKKPKVKLGRPKATEEPTTRVLVTEKSRALAKIAATMERTTMLEYLEQLIKADCTKRGIKID